MKQSDKTKHLLSLIRSGEPMTFGQRLRLVVYLSVPAIIAQLSSIVMQYIDASMGVVWELKLRLQLDWYQLPRGYLGDCVRLRQQVLRCKWHIG